MNAAVWLGAAVFFTAGAGPAFFSTDMETVLGTANYPYYSGAIAEILLARYFHFLAVCAVIAWVHLLAEWLYLGRPARKFSFSLLAVLLALVLAGGTWLQPRLRKLHQTRYALNTQPSERESAAGSFRAWHAVAQLLNLVMVGGLAVYVWRAANPSDAPRFISSVKFRG
jgi:hypothetical protein